LVAGEHMLSEESIPICEKCRRRRAVLRRFYSGEKYCISCLSDVVGKKVKRNLSRSHLLSPGIIVGAVIPPNFIAEGLLGLAYLREIEKRYNSIVYPIFFEAESLDLINLIIKEYGDIVGKRFFVIDGWQKIAKQFSSYGLLGFWGVVRDILFYESDSLDTHVFIMPSCHEFLVQLDLSAFLGSVWDFLCNSSLSSLDESGTTVFINLFHGVPCSETSLLSYHKYPIAFQESLTFARNLFKTTYDNYAWSILVDAVGTYSGEILYSIEKSSRWLANVSKDKPCAHKPIIPKGLSLLESLDIRMREL
jgi:hypothetical protein